MSLLFKQIPLNISFQTVASFNNYIPGPNQTIYWRIQQTLQSGEKSSLFMWGISGTGKTHLLHAACQFISQTGGIAMYLPLKNLQLEDPAFLEQLEAVDLICLDDLQVIAGLSTWEYSVLRLFNQSKDAQIPLFITADVAPLDLGLVLPDLSSRLNWGGVFQLNRLTDEEKILALQKHAQGLGVELPYKVANYLLSHCSRDMQTLIDWLQRLDYLSLAERRKLTLPFVRELLQQQTLKK